jgi:hypothetical protein
MRITSYPAKCAQTLLERGLDSHRTVNVFAGTHAKRPGESSASDMPMRGTRKSSVRIYQKSDEAPEITAEWISGADLYNGKK